MEDKFLYAPKIIYDWENIKVMSTPVKPIPSMGKYWMPIFETQDECKKHYPDRNILFIKKGF